MKNSTFKPRIKPLAGVLRTAKMPAPAKPKLTAKPRMRKCEICKTPFIKRSMAHKACSTDCALAVTARDKAKAAAKAARIDKAETKRKLDEMKPVKWHRAKAKTALHAYIRARDEGKLCISCDTILSKLGRIGGDYDAGHFRSVGSAKHMEFVENNIHGQCKHCNDHLKGNQMQYEIGLINRFGVEYVDALKSDQASRHLGIDDFNAIEVEYKAKLKELKS